MSASQQPHVTGQPRQQHSGKVLTGPPAKHCPRAKKTTGPRCTYPAPTTTQCPIPGARNPTPHTPIAPEIAYSHGSRHVDLGVSLVGRRLRRLDDQIRPDDRSARFSLSGPYSNGRNRSQNPTPIGQLPAASLGDAIFFGAFCSCFTVERMS